MVTFKRGALELAEGQTEERLLGSPTALWKTALRRLFRRKTGIVGMILVGFMFFVAVAAPVIAPYDPQNVLIGKEPVRKRAAPCIHLLGCSIEEPQHIMGVDGNFRDQLSRVIYGARVSLSIGFSTVGFAVTFGVLLAGEVGGGALEGGEAHSSLILGSRKP